MLMQVHDILLLSDQLKDATKNEHAALEKKLIMHIKKIRSADEYVQLLYLMYGYYKAVENKVSLFLNEENLPGFTSRRKADRILNDVQQFSREVSVPGLSPFTANINSYHAALGAMYVLEGSTLGGLIIADMIAKQLNVDTLKGFTFFRVYGDQARQMWSEFKQQIDQPFTSAEQENITEAAAQTFISFKQWIEHNEPK